MKAAAENEEMAEWWREKWRCGRWGVAVGVVGFEFF
jgi:hypothetical protein